MTWAQPVIVEPPYPSMVKGVKDIGAGAITDLDGNFVIDADANQTLVITYIG